MKSYVSSGQTIDILATADIASGDVIDLGAMIAVAVDDIATGETGPAKTDGVITLTKDATKAITQGAQLYYDGTKITTAANDGGSVTYTPAGKAWTDAAAADTEVDVKINV